MRKPWLVTAIILAHGGWTWATQAEYGGASAPSDGVSLKSPKPDCPCSDHLTACPCDGIGAPSWFPTRKPLELGREQPIGPGRAISRSHPDGLPGRSTISNLQDPRRAEESPLPPITL